MKKKAFCILCTALLLLCTGCIKPEEGTPMPSGEETVSVEESSQTSANEYCEVIKGHTVRFVFPETFTDVEVRYEAEFQRFAFVHIPSKEAGGELLYYTLLSESELDPAFVVLGEAGEYSYGYCTAMDVRFLPETEDVFRERIEEIKAFVAGITVE